MVSAVSWCARQARLQNPGAVTSESSPPQEHNAAPRGGSALNTTVRPLETERRLREMLQGKRLVGELDLSPGGTAHEMAKRVFNQVVESGNFWSGRYPSATVVFLVAEGGRCYDEGTFWPNIEGLVATSVQDHSRFGKAFESAVRELALEDFSDAPGAGKWLRYVTPILLHGGIPASCAEDAAQLVLSGVNQGIHDGIELIEGISSSPTRRAQLDKPLERFFVYGGAFALDLVERMIQAVFDINAIGHNNAQQLIPEMAHDLGMPEYLLKALIAGDPIGETVRRRRPPRPAVRIDRFSCAGPYVTFPPVPGGGMWLLSGSSANRHKALQRDEYDVSLVPSPRGWTATLQSNVIESKTRFTGHPNAAAYIFGPDGVLARDQERLSGEVVLLLVAKDIEVVHSDGTPAMFAEELPPRGDSWSGWRLLSLDLSHTDALLLRDKLGEHDVRLPVVRVPQSPVIATQPVASVTGPMGCPVYADVPCVAEPDGTAPSTWRVRWRNDNETTPPATAVLADLPRVAQGRSLGPSLPLADSYCGVLEVVGPLGSDMRSRMAVVRGLSVTVPDRVIGPDETVEVTVDSACVLTCPDGSAGHISKICFEPDCESIELLADGMPLTVTIPRLSWVTSFRGTPAPALGWTRQQLGLDQVDSGEAESLLVRCGRPAKVALELRGHELVQRVEEQAAGDYGRWAFPLTLFRDSIAVSGLAHMRLRLHADDVHADVAFVEAHHEVSNLRVNVADVAAGEFLADVTWKENRRFRNRQVRLWSQHRVWEQPVCEAIPDDADGAFVCVLDAPPGPYLLELAVSDDWVTPQRPALGTVSVIEVNVGSLQDAQRHLRSLQPSTAREALELAVANDPRTRQFDGGTVSTARTELRNAIAVSSGPAVPFETLTRLVRLAMSQECKLVEMLTEELVGALPSSHMLKLTLAMTTMPVRLAATTETIETLWESEPLAAATIDCELDVHSASRWEHFAGWAPDTDTSGVWQPPTPISKPLDTLPPDRLTALADALPPTGSLPLQFGGYRAAAFEMLKITWPDRKQLNDWMSAHARATTYTQRLSPSQHQQIDALAPGPHSAGWHRFPARLQVAAFQLTDEFAEPAELVAAARALLEAAEIAPLLTKRSLLTAVALRTASQA